MATSHDASSIHASSEAGSISRSRLKDPKSFAATPRRSVGQLLLTLGAFVGLWLAIYAVADHAYWLALLLAIPAAGFLVRLFIIQHDCGHGSYFTARWANDWIGRVISILVLTPYDYWRRAHAVHHATSGNLDRRGVGDMPTLTIEEYRSLPPLRRLGYRAIRHPLVIFLVAPVYLFVFQYRLPSDLPIFRNGLWRGVMATNAAIVAFLVGGALLVGPEAFLKVHLPVVLLGSTIGLWMFFVQHQFAGVYWERDGAWDFTTAAVQGSSYYRLPRVLQWLTGHIGLHHVHHLFSKIPNYRLQEYLDENPPLRDVPAMTLLGSLKCVHLALWDESSKSLVSFREADRLAKASAA